MTDPDLAPDLAPHELAPPLPFPVVQVTAPVALVGAPVLVQPALRSGPAVLVAAQDLWDTLMEEFPLYRRDGTAHVIVTWLLGLGLASQRAWSFLTTDQRQHHRDMLTACGLTCVVTGPVHIQGHIVRALVAAHFLCADCPIMVPSGLAGRIPFRSPLDGRVPALKRRGVWVDL